MENDYCSIKGSDLIKLFRFTASANELFKRANKLKIELKNAQWYSQYIIFRNRPPF